MQKPTIISLEGNIGAGKTTFLKVLKEQLGQEFEMINEPVNKWIQVGNTNMNMLDNLYKDTPRWAYTFESLSLLSKLQLWEEIEKNPKKNLIFSERCIYSDRNVFAKNFVKNGLMTEGEMEIYEQWFEYGTRHMRNLGGIIYLKSSPETCQKRCQKRAREEEAALEFRLFSQLYDRHEEWLNNPEEQVHCPVLIIDTDIEFESNESQQQVILEQVRNFIRQIQ